MRSSLVGIAQSDIMINGFASDIYLWEIGWNFSRYRYHWLILMKLNPYEIERTLR